MAIEEKLREDIWKAIQAHYERADYTEAVRDAMFHICELLREKSGLVDKDGTKLVFSLSKAAKDDFCRVVSKSLMKCKEVQLFRNR